MDNSRNFALLKSSHLTAKLTDAQIGELAPFFAEEHVARGEELLREGDRGPGLCYVLSGRVRLSTVRAGGMRTSMLGAGDIFGEGSVLRVPEAYTAHATADAVLLRLPTAHSASLLAKYPRLAAPLGLALRSRAFAAARLWPWLGEDETIYLATRRSRVVLVLALLLPGAIALLSLAAIGLLAALGGATLYYALPAAGLLLAAVAASWSCLDWSNDLYVATSQRLIIIERLPFIYEDRKEAPLRSLLSVEVDSSAVKHWVGFGSVVARTFTRPLVLDSIPDPHESARLIQELCVRARGRQEESERGEIEQALTQRLGKSPSPRSPAPGQAAPEVAGGSKSIRVRFQVGDRIIYRKDPYFLFGDLVPPLMVILFGAALLALAGARLLPEGSWVPWAGGAVLVAAGLGWGVYAYIDWANDLYMVTPDQIIALHRTPLGREDHRAASLDNILSLEYDRPGPMARLLNFGNVVVTVGNLAFTFDRVHDPVGVQEDIYRRMEAHRTQRDQTERTRRSEEIAEWLEAYHRVVGSEDGDPGQGD